MTGRACYIFALLAVSALITPSAASAQTSYLDEPGVPAFTMSFPVEGGFINLANGALHIEIPIATYAQRGNIKDLRARLVYDSRIWKVRTDPVTGAMTWVPTVPSAGVSVGGGFRLITDGEAGFVSFSTTTQNCGSVNGHPVTKTTYTGYTYQEADGTTHRTAPSFKLYLTSPGACGSLVPTGSAFAADNSGYKFVVTNGSCIVYAPDGTQVTPNTSTQAATPGTPMVQDTNGNFYTYANGQYNTFTNVVDTLGRTLVVTTFSENQVFLDYLCEQGCNPSNGDRARVVINTAPATWATHFNQLIGGTAVGEYSGGGFGDVQNIILADGSTFGFQQDSYGQITNVTLPTNGQISYGYTNFLDLQSNVNRWVTSRVVDGNTWTFTPTIPSCSAQPCTQQVTVTTPPYSDGAIITSDTRVYTFTITNGNSGGAWNNQIQYFRGAASGTPVLTKNTDYGFAGSCPAVQSFTGGLPIRETLTWPAASGTLSKKVEYCYDGNANITAKKMWDFQPNGNFAASPDREVDTTYVTDPSYINANILRLQSTATTLSAGVQVAQTTYAHDAGSLQPSGVTTNHVTPSVPRGNLTSVGRWLNTTGNNVTQTISYYDTGETYQSKDPLLNPTTYFYDSTGAYPNQTCNAKNQCSYSAYDFNTGLLTTFTDPNGSSLGDPAHTTTYTYDSMLRHLCNNFPDGGQSCNSYPDPNHIDQQQKVTSALTDYSVTILDDLGRVSENQHTTPNGVVKVDTQHDAVGAISTVTNPYYTTNDSTYGITQSYRDALGRTVLTIKQDGSRSAVTYSANCATTTDEANKQQKSCSDALGRLTNVWEDPNGLNYESDYVYDALGNLLSVKQNGSNSANARVRTFSYDSLSRLVSASNPESGTISYTYDANGNVLTKTAPAPNQTGSATVVTCFGNWTGTSCDGTGYDSLNRVTQKSYSDGTPSAFFAYDGTGWWGVTQTNTVGRLMEEWTGTSCCATGGAIIFGYDSMGRVVLNTQFTPAMGYQSVSYAYDLAGDMTSSTTGVGVTFSQSFDSARRVTQLASNLADWQHPGTLATVDSSIGYYATGALRKVTFGNGLTETAAFNNRLQPCRNNVNSSGSALLNCGDSVPAGNVQDFAFGFSLGASDNGNLASFSGSGAQSFNRGYGYDSLNRLQSMSAPGDSCSGLSWTYDAWANRTDQTVTGGSCNPFHQLVDTNNRISGTGYLYDSAGNMTNDSSHSYTYDAENRIIQVDGGNTASYAYDALGRRVHKNTPSLWTDYIYDLSGNVVTEYTNTIGCGPPCWYASHIYLNGRLLADYKDGTTYFAHKDHLGSTRLLTAAGLGTRIQSSGGTSTVPYFFNGVCPSASGVTYSIFVWVKNQGSTSVRIGANIVDGPVIPPGTTQRVLFAGTGDGVACAQLRFETLNPGDAIDVVAYSPSINASGTQLIPPANSNFSGWNTWAGSSVTLTQGLGFVNDSLDYLPYGEQIAGGTYTTHKFTGKERDGTALSETGLDYFGARFLSSPLGRFTSPDPGSAGAEATDPESWNGYSYVGNNPVNRTDPDGRDYHLYGPNNGFTGDVSDAFFNRWCKQNACRIHPDGSITNGNGDLLGYERWFDGEQARRLNNEIAFMNWFGLNHLTQVLTAPISGVVAGLGIGGEVAPAATEMIGGVSEATLQAAAEGGGETVTVFTRLTQLPQAGRPLYVAVGDGAEALAGAARTGGQTFTAQIPKAFMNLCLRTGLAQPETTLMQGSASTLTQGSTATAIRFSAEVTKFIVSFFH